MGLGKEITFGLLWEKFGDIPINNDDEIEEDFLHFKKDWKYC